MAEWWNYAAALADPTGIYVTSKVIEEAAERETEARAPRPAPSAPAEVAPSDERCCPEYQLEGEFLLNTRTGAVWKYDDTAKAFAVIPKEKTAIQKAVWDVTKAAHMGAFRDTMLAQAGELHHSERDRFEKSYDAFLKAMDNEWS